MSLSCTVAKTLSLISQTPKDVAWLWMHLFQRYSNIHALVHLCIHVICLVSPTPKIWFGQNLRKRVTWPWPRPLGVVCHPKDSIWCILSSYEIWRLVSAIPEIWLRASKLKMGHVTLTRPLLRVVCCQDAGTWHSLCVQNLTAVASAVPQIRLDPTKI